MFYFNLIHYLKRPNSAPSRCISVRSISHSPKYRQAQSYIDNNESSILSTTLSHLSTNPQLLEAEKLILSIKDSERISPHRSTSEYSPFKVKHHSKNNNDVIDSDVSILIRRDTQVESWFLVRLLLFVGITEPWGSGMVPLHLLTILQVTILMIHIFTTLYHKFYSNYSHFLQ